jgi:hypothetical protein
MSVENLNTVHRTHSEIVPVEKTPLNVTTDPLTGFYYETRTAAEAYYVRAGRPEMVSGIRRILPEELF